MIKTVALMHSLVGLGGADRDCCGVPRRCSKGGAMASTASNCSSAASSALSPSPLRLSPPETIGQGKFLPLKGRLGRRCRLRWHWR